jgi:hypothetical protein
LAFAKLIPSLGANAHAAARALLIVDAGDTSAARAAETVKADKPLGIDERPDSFALDIEGVELNDKLLLMGCDAGAGFFMCPGLDFNLGAGLGESGFLSLCALETDELFCLEAIELRGLKDELVLDGFSLGGSFDGIKLSAEAGSLLAMLGDFAIESGAEGFFPGERGRSLVHLMLCGSERGRSLGELSGQCAHLLIEASALQFDGLQLYEVFNERLHLCLEGYDIGAVE